MQEGVKVESKLFHRSMRKNQRQWFGFQHWMALRSCTDTKSWLNLGYQLAGRSLNNTVQNLNVGPLVTQFCLVTIAIAAAVAIP